MILAQSQYAPAAPTQYPNSTSSEFIIDYFVAYNGDAAAQSLSVWVVPLGSSTNGGNLRAVVSIAAGESYILTEIVGDTLASGESVWVQAGTASTISFKISGRLR